jgi:hypothetical protein
MGACIFLGSHQRRERARLACQGTRMLHVPPIRQGTTLPRDTHTGCELTLTPHTRKASEAALLAGTPHSPFPPREDVLMCTLSIVIDY